MQTVLLVILAVAVYYYLFKQIDDQKKQREQALKEKEANERRAREEKERERRELERITAIRANEPGIKKVASKSGFVGKCPSCGASIKDSAMFCMYCGTNLADSIQEHVEYIDSRTPIEKKMDIEYAERMARIEQEKRDSWIMPVMIIVVAAMMLGATLLFAK